MSMTLAEYRTRAELLERFRIETGSQFAALAEAFSLQGTMKWTVISGNRNDRVGKMTVKAGIGLAGMVRRLGIMCRSRRGKESGLASPPDCPVMLAEQLQEAVAFPIAAPDASTAAAGVLLMGRRQGADYAPSDIEAGLRYASVFSSWLNPAFPSSGNN